MTAPEESRVGAAPVDAPVALVVLAAGEGRRVGATTNKVLLPLAGRTVLEWSMSRAAGLPGLRHVVVVVRPEEQDDVRRLLDATPLPTGTATTVVTGGDTRHASERQALVALRHAVATGEVEVVLVHDGARPLARTALFAAVARAALDHGGALPVVDQPCLLPRSAAVPVVADLTVAVQTPQGFRARPLLAAYDAAERDGFAGSDTASCFERYAGLPVHGVPGDATNLKITFPEDVPLAERLLAAEPVRA